MLLTNGGSGRERYKDLSEEIVGKQAGVAMPAAPLAPPNAPPSVDIAWHTGHYERASVEVDVFVRDGTRSCGRS